MQIMHGIPLRASLHLDAQMLKIMPCEVLRMGRIPDSVVAGRLMDYLKPDAKSRVTRGT
jgi:hypothetical protein